MNDGRMVTIKVVQDLDPDSPREWANLGVMACWHRRYTLGDVQPAEEPAEWLKENAPEGSVVLPLYLYDHSGISMSTSRTYPFDCPWDSGQVGFIVASPAKIREHYEVKRITKKVRDQVETRLRAEVEVYDAFLRGDVWGYTLEVTHSCGECGSAIPDEGEGDSCWGFYGDSALEDMKAHVAEEHHAALEEAWERRGAE